MQEVFQRRVVEFVENPARSKPPTQFITETAKTRFIADARNENKAILLLDVPAERKPSSFGLEYLIEEDRRRFKKEELRTEKLEHSIVWRTLQKCFQESIAKLRIFCDPAHAEFLAPYTSDERLKLERILGDALREAEGQIEEQSTPRAWPQILCPIRTATIPGSANAASTSRSRSDPLGAPIAATYYKKCCFDAKSLLTTCLPLLRRQLKKIYRENDPRPRRRSY